MIEVKDATSFIQRYEAIYKKKVYRFPFVVSDNKEVALLMTKCSKSYVSLPYLSQGIIETLPQKYDFSFLSKHWQIRDSEPHSKYVYTQKVNFEIDLRTNYNYTSPIRRKIRKALKSKINIHYGKSQKLIDDFYTIYTKRMHQLGVPPVSKTLIKHKVKEDYTLLFVAYKGTKPIGAASLDKITRTYFENNLMATLPSFNKYYTSYLLHHFMITYSKSQEAQTYSFGRSTKESPVYAYKKHYKAKEIPLYWSFSHKKTLIHSHKILFSLWKLLPYKLSNLIGGFFHKRIY
jgi:hypothetical protein